jgi:hypothetical protein
MHRPTVQGVGDSHAQLDPRIHEGLDCRIMPGNDPMNPRESLR